MHRNESFFTAFFTRHLIWWGRMQKVQYLRNLTTLYRKKNFLAYEKASVLRNIV